MSEKERSINQIWKAKSGHIMKQQARTYLDPFLYEITQSQIFQHEYFEQKQNKLVLTD